MAKQNKDTQRGYFYTGAFPTAQQMKDVVDSQLGVLDESTSLPAASADNLGNEYKVGNVYYKCVLVEGSYVWQQTGTVVPSNDYTDIANKPKIGSTTLAGSLAVKQIGGLDADITQYQQVAETDPQHMVYVYDGASWKKATIEQIRRPSVLQVEILSSDWQNVGGGVYRASKSVSGISSDSVPFASPAPESMSQYVLTPYWLAGISNGNAVIESESEIQGTVYLNIAYW